MEARASRGGHISAGRCSKPRPAHAHATVLFCCHNEFCSFIVAAAHVPDDARDSPAEARAQLSASALRMCCWRSQVSTVVAAIQVSCIYGAVPLLDVAVAAATLAAAAVLAATLPVSASSRPPSPSSLSRHRRHPCRRVAALADHHRRLAFGRSPPRRLGRRHRPQRLSPLATTISCMHVPHMSTFAAG